uniref:COHA1 n=1 Tax=Gasterosteus aculeatus aculeatus TaxID=481459 RepID=A0AAQ4QEP5_GASAC
MDELTRQMDFSGGLSEEKVVRETVTSTSRLTSLPPKGTSGSNHRNMSSGAGGLGLEKNVLTQNSSGGGAGSRGGGSYLVSSVSKVRSSSSGGARRAQTAASSGGLSPASRERKSVSGRSGGYDGSSSGNSSPEFTRKDYGIYCSSGTRGRSESRESEIRARLQSASPSASRWTELDDVKKLLKGRSCSVSPTRSSSASVTLPVPKKASVETKTISVASQSGLTSFGSGVRSAGFQTIDTSGFFDTGLTSEQFDSGVKPGHYDVTLKSGQHDTGVKSGHYGVGLKSGQYDTGVKSGQYDTSLKSGQYDTTVRSAQYDTGVRSAQYDTGVRSAQYDTGVRSALYDTSVRSAQYDTGVRSAQYDTGVRSAQYDTGVRSAQYDTGVRSVQYDTSVRSGQYDTLDATLPTFSWSTTTLPSASTTVIAGNTSSSYAYQGGTNNMAGGTSPVGLTSPSSLSVYGFQNNLASTSPSVLTTSGGNVHATVGGYGVQKNLSNGGGGVVSSGVSTTTRSQADDSYKKDYKFLVSDKENAPVKRDAEMLILAKDSGKHFTSSSVQMGGGSISGDSMMKEKLISSYSETMPLKTEKGNSYYGSSGVVMKDKATYAEIHKENGIFGGGGLCCCSDACCSWWKWLLGLLLLSLLLLGLLFGLIALAEDVRSLKNRVSTLEAESSVAAARTSRFSASSNDINTFGAAGAGGAAHSDNVLHVNAGGGGSTSKTRIGIAAGLLLVCESASTSSSEPVPLATVGAGGVTRERCCRRRCCRRRYQL